MLLKGSICYMIPHAETRRKSSAVLSPAIKKIGIDLSPHAHDTVILSKNAKNLQEQEGFDT